MANTFTQIHLHAVFAVKYRLGLIHPSWKNELYKYITGIIQSKGHRLLIINGMPDHIHILFGMRPTQSLSELMQDIKGSSSKWINEMNFVTGRFEWQEGYGAFSYDKSKLPFVVNYIQTQEEHHRKIDFIGEYKSLLEQFEIKFEERYIFKAPV